MFCKTATTASTINFLSYHPMKHKIATCRHVTRMCSLPLTPMRKQTEWTLIQLIVRNKNFLQKLIQNLNLQIQHKKTNQEQTNEKKKTTFTCYSPRIRKITKLFRHTVIGISYKSTNEPFG